MLNLASLVSALIWKPEGSDCQRFKVELDSILITVRGVILKLTVICVRGVMLTWQELVCDMSNFEDLSFYWRELISEVWIVRGVVSTWQFWRLMIPCKGVVQGVPKPTLWKGTPYIRKEWKGPLLLREERKNERTCWPLGISERPT